MVMNEIEWDPLDSRKKEHEEILAVTSDLGRLGYLISGISHKNGALEVICYPPDREEESKKKLYEALEAGYGIDGPSHELSMDGVSDSFKV